MAMNTIMYLGVTVASLVILFILQIVTFRKFGNAIIENIGEGINTLLGEEPVKRAMSIIGKKGGDTKAVNAIKNKLAKGTIQQNYGMLKMLGEKFLGVDVDEMIDEYGAENILTAVSQLAPKLGIDVNSLLSGKMLNSNPSIVYPREE